MNKEELNVLLDNIYELEGLVHLALAREDCPESIPSLIRKKARAVVSLLGEGEGNGESGGNSESGEKPNAGEADIPAGLADFGDVGETGAAAGDAEEAEGEMPLMQDMRDVPDDPEASVTEATAFDAEEVLVPETAAYDAEEVLVPEATAYDAEEIIVPEAFEAEEVSVTEAYDAEDTLAPEGDDSVEFEVTPQAQTESAEEVVSQPEVAVSHKIAEPRGKLVFTINDRYRFKRDLFCNSDADFNTTLALVASMDSYDEAEDYFLGELQWNPQREGVMDFLEILKNYFK